MDYAQQGLQLASTTAGLVSSFAQLFGGHDVARVAGQIQQGTGAASGVVGSLRGMVPTTMPGPARSYFPGAPPPASAPGAPGAPAAAPGGQFDATALLGLLMNNPQLRQALSSIPVFGQGAPETIELTIPAQEGTTTVYVPVRHAVAMVAELAARSALEVSAEADEAVIAAAAYAPRTLHHFRLAREAEHFGGSNEGFDESEVWAAEDDD
jgi:hypothetical protein